MDNIFLETSSSITKEEIIEVASKLDIKLSDEFINHYTQYNGGYPIRRFYKWPDGASTRIDHFFSIKYEGFTHFEEAYNDLFIIEQVLPLGYVPFAVDDGGNFFCFSVLPSNYNSVFYAAMYHYSSENPSDYLTIVGLSFKNFIDNLSYI
jgi:hypothetical protein